MNKNEYFAKLPAPLHAAHFEFNQSYIVSRSLAVAGLTVAGYFAAKAVKRFRQERQVSAEAEQMLVDQEQQLSNALGALVLDAETL